VGDFFTLNIRIAFGDGCDCASYDALQCGRAVFFVKAAEVRQLVGDEGSGGLRGLAALVHGGIQHTAGSPFWRLLHTLPNGGGGYSQWAIPAGAPPN
jgi:hypothetical protein